MRECKVIRVEDYPDIRAYFACSWRERGFAFAGDVAVDGLPGCENGLALAVEVAGSGLAVILVTGHPQYFEAIEKSDHPYMLNPFRLEALLGMVYRAARS